MKPSRTVLGIVIAKIRNQPKTNQASQKPPKPAKNQPNHPKNQSKPAKTQPNHPKIKADQPNQPKSMKIGVLEACSKILRTNFY